LRPRQRASAETHSVANLLKASSGISRQNPPSSAFDSLQVITYRLNQSITAAKDMNPEAIGTHVISMV
jgi:hypothetical protein